MTARWRWAFCLLVVAGVTLGADGRREKIPKDVQQAEQRLNKWLSTFEDQSTADVRKTLGMPDEEETWEFEKKSEPLLKYKVGETTELSLYFHDGKVVKTSLHLL